MKFDVFRSAFGENVRRARRAAHLTLEELAARALTNRLLSAIENGRGNPTLETVFILARTLQVQPHELLICAAAPAGYVPLDKRDAPVIPPGRKKKPARLSRA